MVTMPGTPIVPDDAEDIRPPTPEPAPQLSAPYMPEKSLQSNPFDAYVNDPNRRPAQRMETADVSWKERFLANVQNVYNYDVPGADDLKDIQDEAQQRDLLINGRGGVYQQTEADATADADRLRYERSEKLAAYNRMPWSNSAYDWSAAVLGTVWGGVTSPSSLVPVGKITQIGSAGWRMTYPMFSRILDSIASNAAMNAALNAAIQAEEAGSGMREEVDWLSLGADAAFGAAFGVPFGMADGMIAKQEARQATAPAAPAAPVPPPVIRETPPLEGMQTPTPEQMQAEFTAADLAQAQVDLFGEVVGTRNLTPEQLSQLDDHLNGGKAADIPQAPPETEGGLTNDMPPTSVRDAFLEADAPPAAPAAPVEATPATPEAMPPVQEAAPAEVPPQAAPPPLPIDRTERQFRPSELKVDAKRFQFKEGGDEAGVTDRLKGVKKWDPIKSGVTLVWEDLNGDFYIADGHQRHGLASRLEADGQEPKIRAVVLREADGVSAEDARAIAAAKNIAEGTGNAIDAAKILRSRPDMGVDLPPTSALVRDAQGLASLSDDAFGMVINKKVPAGYAAQVGRLAPDPKTHAELLGLLAKEQPDNAIEAESMIRDALEAPAVQSTMEDMFGSAEVTQILFKERAQVLSAAATAIRKDRAAFATLVREEARLTGAGNKLATQTNAERASQDAEILANLQAQARRKGPIADALAAAAKQLKDGTSRQVVVRDFLDNLRRSGEATGSDGRGAGPAGRADETGIAARLEPTPQPEAAFRTNEDVSGTYYVLRVQGKDEPVRGRNAGDPMSVAIHLLNSEEDFGPESAYGIGDTLYLYEITAPDQKAGPYKQANTGRMDKSDQIGASKSSYGVIYSFGQDAKFTERVVAAVPLQRARDILKEQGYVGGNGEGNFNQAGGNIGGAAIKRALNEALADTGIAFSRRPPIDKGPSLFDAAPPPATTPRLKAFQEKMAERGKIQLPPGVTIKKLPNGDFSAVHNGQQIGFLALEKFGEAGKNREAFQMAVKPEWQRKGIMAALHDFAEKDGGPITPSRTLSDEGFAFWKGYRPEAVRDRLRFDKEKYLGQKVDVGQGRTGVVTSVGDKTLIATIDGANGATTMVSKAETDRLMGGRLEPGADNRPQMVLPGAERIGDKRLAEMRAAAPLKPQRAQKQMDIGLFSDEADQQGFAFRDEMIGTGLPDLIANQAPIEQIANHPFVLDAVRRMAAVPLTHEQPGYMSPDWKAARTYNFPDGQVVGYDAAIDRLVEGAKGFSTNGPVKAEKVVTILLGPPAAGKSTHAEKIAAARFAAIVDPDEAKLVIPEFQGGIGANAVHEESAEMAADVLYRLTQDGVNMVIPKVGGSEGGIRKLVLSMKRQGYRVNLVSMNVTYENAFRRMIGRFMSKGRLINPEYVAEVGIKPTTTYRILRAEGVADGYAEIDGNGGLGQVPRLLDDTGALDGVPGYGPGRGGDGNLSPQAGSAREGPAAPSNEGIAFSRRAPQALDPLTQPGGEWRTIDIMAVDENGKAIRVNAGDAADFMVTRINSLRQLLECVNAG